MSKKTTKTTKAARPARAYNPHAWFFAQIKKDPAYSEAHKESYIAGTVHHFSSGRTTSLSDMHARYPIAYAAMRRSLVSQDDGLRRQLLAALHQWAASSACGYNTDQLKAIACRASGYRSFNAIPASKLRGLIYEFNNQKEAARSAKEVKELYTPSFN